MAPPELAADAPVADVFVPGLKGFGVAGGVEAERVFTPSPRTRGEGLSVSRCSDDIDASAAPASLSSVTLQYH